MSVSHRRAYCPKDSEFTDYYGHQSGRGFGDIRVVRGPRYQRGYGFGSFFSRLAIPFIKFIGREALSKGVVLTKKVAQDPQIQQAFKDSVKDLARKGLSKLVPQESEQQGTGRKRLYKRKKVTTKSSSSKRHAPKRVKKTVAKVSPKRIQKSKPKVIRRKKDIFS